MERNTNKDLDIVEYLMKEAEAVNMQYEVILYALYNMKQNPDYSVEGALKVAMAEWDI